MAETGASAPALDGAAVVATLDRPELLAACLASLAAADPPYGEIVVVDQSAGEAQRELARAHGARYLHLDRRGLSLARNAGIAATSREWIHFPDDDCTVAPDLLAAVARGLERQPGAGFVCAHIEIPGGRPIMAGMDGRERPIDSPAEVLRTTMSPGLFVRRRVLERIGGFDERFGVGGEFPSGEESDLLFRALAAGESGRYLPGARVFHPDQFASQDAEGQRRRAFQYGRGWGALFAKHASRPAGSFAAALHRRYLVRAAGGAALAWLAARTPVARRYAASLRGRSQGWREWGAASTAADSVGSPPVTARGPWRALLARPVLANSVALVALRGGNLAARLLLLFVIAHQVSPAAFGRVVFALSIAEIAKVLSDFGMDTLAIREYAAERDPEAHARFASSLATAKLLFGVAVYLGLAATFALAQPPEQAALGMIIGATTLTALLTNFSIDFFQARLRIGRVLAPALTATTGLALVAALLVSRVSDLRAQAAFFPAIEAGTGLVLLALLRREGRIGRPRLAFEGVARLVSGSLPIAVTAILIMTYSRLDVLVLSSRLDAAAVGLYGIAFRVTEPFQIAAAAFGLSVFSRFSSWFHHPVASALRRSARRYVTATLGYGTATALALGWLAPPLIERILPAYAPSIPILRILAAALVFRTLNATLAGILQGAGRFRLLTLIAAWNLVLVFVLLQGLVGRFQAPGAALALLIGEAANSALQLFFVTRVVTHTEGITHRVG